MTPIQLTKYKTFFFFFLNNTKSLFDFIYLKVALCPLWPKNLLNPYNPWLIIRVLRELRGETKKSKTNPKRTQTNPIFWRTNPILSPKMGIFDKFRQTFLCKTNPICFYPVLNFEPVSFYYFKPYYSILRRSFLRVQGLGSAESAGVLSYIEHFGLCRKRRNRKKEPAKCLILNSEYGRMTR